jgi:hypothetical protein
MQVNKDTVHMENIQIPSFFHIVLPYILILKWTLKKILIKAKINLKKKC